MMMTLINGVMQNQIMNKKLLFMNKISAFQPRQKWEWKKRKLINKMLKMEKESQILK